MISINYTQEKLIHCILRVLILVMVYLVSLSSETGAIGGIIFFIFGFIIPTAIFFIIAYYISFELLIFKNVAMKVIAFIIFSFILCLNTKLLYILNIKSYQPTNFHLQVINPLQKPIESAKYFIMEPIDSILIDDSLPNEDLKSSPLGFTTLGCNADSGFYWTNSYLTRKTTYQLSTDHVLYSDGYFNNGEYRVYIKYEMFKRNKDFILHMTLRDNINGHIKMQATYPGSLYINKNNYYNQIEDHGIGYLKDSHFLVNAFDSLLHNNIWNKALQFFDFYQTKTLYDLLREQKGWENLSSP